MAKKSYKKHNQKIYKMKGCNKNKCNKKTCRKRRKSSSGGGDLGLAYPNNNIYKGSNSNLAYTGAGSGKNAAYPNEGVTASDGRMNFINPSGLQHGGETNGMVGTPWTPNVNGWPGLK